VNEKGVLGLDLGTTKVCALVGEIAEDQQVTIRGVGVSPSPGLRQGVIYDPEATLSHVRAAVEKAQQTAGMSIASTYVGVTGLRISSGNQRGPVKWIPPGRAIVQADVDQARAAVLQGRSAPDREVIMALDRGFFLDGRRSEQAPVGRFGQRLEIDLHVVAAEKEFAEAVRRCVTQAQSGPVHLVSESIAAAAAVTTPQERQLGVAVLDIGGGTSDLAIYTDGVILHTQTFPLGGGHVSYDVAFGLGARFAEAEQVKRRFGCALMEWVQDDEMIEVPTREGTLRPHARRFLAEIIEARMEELFLQVGQALAPVTKPQTLLGGLVLTGGGSQFPGTLELAHRILGLHPRLGTPEPLTGLADEFCQPMYAASVGLLRHAATASRPPARPRPSDPFWERARGRLSRCWQHFWHGDHWRF